MNDAFKDGARQYAIAVCLTILATSIRQIIHPWVGEQVPFGTYLLSVLLTAWIAGSGPALLALFLGIVIACFLFATPFGRLTAFDVADMVSLTIYGIVGLVAIVLFHRTSAQHAVTRGQFEQIGGLTRALQKADQRKDQFLALLAHELRNPLAPIRTGVKLLEERTPDGSSLSILATMDRQLEQLVRLVDDLLDVSRIVHGRVNLRMEQVDLRDMIAIALEQAKPMLDERLHTLMTTIPPTAVLVNGDRIRLVQVIVNLLTNAAKYTPREGTIQLLVDIEPNCVQVNVIDNGIGIAGDMQPDIFQMFVRSKTATLRDQGGLGLGLPLARHLAEMHGGTLEVYSRGAGQGSQFTFTIPSEEFLQVRESQSSPEAANRMEDAEREIASDQSFTAARILIVDDNIDAADMLAAFLAFDGAETRVAADGCAALQELRTFQPNVVLLDIGMPGMDGYEVARRMRAESKDDQLKIIAVTGWGADSDVQLSREAGMDDHLVKPVDPIAIREMLGLSSPQPSLAD